MDVFIIVWMVLLFLFFGIIASKIARSTRQRKAQKIADDNSPVETAVARVVTKRTQVSGISHPDMPSSTSTAYFCTFEFPNGTRREFPVSGSEFGLLVEGDEGQLTFQGSRYKGFQR